MRPPLFYRVFFGILLTPVVLVAAFAIKMAELITWWKWEDVDIGGVKIL